MMLVDGNVEFVKVVGLEFDGSGFGMGVCVQCFFMLVKDGVVFELNVEVLGEFKVLFVDYIFGQFDSVFV